MSARCELVAITKRYGRRLALQSVTLTLKAGEILGLVGPNGAGKTTILRIVAGLVHPTTGQIQRSALRPGSVRYFAGERSLPPDVSARRWWRLWARRAPHEFGRRRMAVLSRGMRQRLGLETTLWGDAPSALILLDEPWEGLDPDAARWLSHRLVEKRNIEAAVLVSSHRIHDLADVCDRCVFLNNGRLVDEVILCPPVGVGVDRSALLFEAFDRMRRTK